LIRRAVGALGLQNADDRHAGVAELH
jgi:hypothetical protein